MHQSLSKAGLIKDKELPGVVLSIGNHSFGGTGKTPVTIAIAKYLANQGFNVAILSRGYKAKNKNKEAIVFNCLEDNLEIDVDSIGDEAFEIYQSCKADGLDVSLGVCSNRYEAGLIAKEKYASNLFILDDGMQHLGLKKDIEILLLNVNESGFLREFKSEAIKKANYILYTKVDDQWLIDNPHKEAVKFELNLNPDLSKILNTENISQDHWGIFTGIADYKTLKKMVENKIKYDSKNGINTKVLEFIYPDHHYFTIDEVTRVLSLGIKIITTEKDFSKIPEELQSKFIVAKLNIEFVAKDFLQNLGINIKELLKKKHY